MIKYNYICNQSDSTIYLLYYWLIVSVITAIIRPVFHKNLKRLEHIVQNLHFILLLSADWKLYSVQHFVRSWSFSVLYFSLLLSPFHSVRYNSGMNRIVKVPYIGKFICYWSKLRGKMGKETSVKFYIVISCRIQNKTTHVTSSIKPSSTTFFFPTKYYISWNTLHYIIETEMCVCWHAVRFMFIFMSFYFLNF